MKIAICDDDTYYREHILSVVKEYSSENKSMEISVVVFTHAEQLLDHIDKNGGFDIYILDIVMPGMNGIDLGKKLREKGFTEKILYFTTSDDFAVDSYKVGASDYILKPADDKELISTIDRIANSISDRKTPCVIVKTKEGSIKIPFDNIFYAELVKRTAVYHLRDGNVIKSITIRTNFEDTTKTLINDKRFVSCGKSLLLNMHHISRVESEEIVFDQGNKISAGKKLCREVHKAWLAFYFDEENRV